LCVFVRRQPESARGVWLGLSRHSLQRLHFRDLRTEDQILDLDHSVRELRVTRSPPACPALSAYLGWLPKFLGCPDATSADTRRNSATMLW
jgi:hypothetical protein